MKTVTRAALAALSLVTTAVAVPEARPRQDPAARRPAPERIASSRGALRQYNGLLAEGSAAFARGAYQTATGLFDEARSLVPTHAIAHLAAGHAAFAWGEFDGAGERLRAGVRRRPAWPDSPRGMASVQARPRMLAQRRGELEAGLERSPSLDRRFLLGYVQYFEGELEAARESFGEVHHQAPEDPAPVAFLAAIARRQGVAADSTDAAPPAATSGRDEGGPSPGGEAPGWIGR